MAEPQGSTGIGTQVNLPLSKAIEISFNSVKIRFGRSLITVSGIVLSIAFLMSIWVNTDVINSIKMAGDPKLDLILQQKGIDTDPGSVVRLTNNVIWECSAKFLNRV